MYPNISLLSCLTIVAAANTASPALAEESKAFDGFHIGGLLGYDVVSPGADGTTRSVDGLQYGVELGRDFQIDRLVLGFGSEYSGSTIRDGENIGSLRVNRLKPGGDFFIGGRIGYVMTPTIMVYGKVGYTSTKLRVRYENAAFEELEDRPKISGVRLGIGAEQNLSSKIYVKAEYRYSNYDNIRITNPDDLVTDVDISIDRSQFLIGAGLRF